MVKTASGLHRSKTVLFVKGYGRLIRFPDLEPDVCDIAPAAGAEKFVEQYLCKAPAAVKFVDHDVVYLGVLCRLYKPARDHAAYDKANGRVFGRDEAKHDGVRVLYLLQVILRRPGTEIGSLAEPDQIT